MINQNNLTDIYSLIKEEISNNFVPECNVTTLAEDTISKNTVVIEEAANILGAATTRREENLSIITYEINIYSPIDFYKEVDGTVIALSRMEQARELSAIIEKVLGDKLRFERTYCSPTPNIDINIYRITMRYSARYLDSRNRFII